MSRVGMGIETPRFLGFSIEVYVGARAPRLSTRSRLEPRGAFTPNPIGLGRLSRAGLLRTRRQARRRRPSNRIIGLSAKLDLGITGPAAIRR